MLLTAIVSAAMAQADDDAVVRPLSVGDAAMPFLVRDCTGPAAGKRLCYMCRYGARPTVAVFIRDCSGTSDSIVKLIDTAVRDHRQRRLAAFVVLLAKDTESAEQQLKALAASAEISETPLTIFSDAPNKLDAYGLGQDSPLTVMLWRGGRLRSLHQVAENSPRGATRQAIEQDLQKILR